MSINFLDPSVELILEDDPFKKIELAGRTCYKSESSITSESSKKFVKNLMKNQHMAMVEHANVVFSIDCNVNDIRNVADYVNFLNGRDSQIRHEGEEVLGFQKRPLL